MGLDNGVCIKFKDLKEKLSSNLTKKLKLFDSLPYENDYTILYWRKCWNVRSLFQDFCSKNNIDYQEADNTYLTIDEVIKFIECLLVHHNKKWWEGESNNSCYFYGSIWDWNDVKYYKRTYRAALKLFAYIKKEVKEDSYNIYFYDSY